MPDEIDTLIHGALMPGVCLPDPESWVETALAKGVESVCLFRDAVGSPERTHHTTSWLRAMSPHVLIAVDEEAGEVTRVEALNGSSVLSPYALGAVNDPEVTRAEGRLVGGMLRELGIDWDLAPVADVNVDPLNPVIGVRSFGSDAELVSSQVAAFVDGLQSMGVLSCPKHFPGHGDTHVDSHESLPTLGVSHDILQDRELRPFRSAIDAGAASVMTGHLRVPVLDDEAPATLSATITTELLRNSLGFAGVIITDAIEMGAVSGAGRSGLGAAAVAALRAGADVVCLGADDQEQALETCAAAIRQSIADGQLDPALLRAAAQRRAAMRASRTARPDGVDRHGDEVVLAEHAALSVSSVGNVLIDAPGIDVMRVAADPGYAAGETGWGVVEHLVAAGRDVAAVGDGAVPDLAVGRALVVETRDAWKGEQLTDRLAAIVAERPDAVVIDFGWPLVPLTTAGGWITTRGTGRLSSALAASVLLGANPVDIALTILQSQPREYR